MQIEANKVVTFHYKLSETGGQFIEDSRDSDPMVYLHGHKNVIPGLEEGLAGKKVGDKFNLDVPTAKAYGERKKDAIQRVSQKHIVTEGKKVQFKPGMFVHLNTAHGPQMVMVLKVGLKTLDVDINHPLAGMDLSFEVEVVDIRDATEEEVEHGHVHGEGGVQH